MNNKKLEIIDEKVSMIAIFVFIAVTIIGFVLMSIQIGVAHNRIVELRSQSYNYEQANTSMNICNCPYCDSNESALYKYDKDGVQVYKVKCDNCNAVGPAYSTAADAINSWNEVYSKVSKFL